MTRRRDGSTMESESLRLYCYILAVGLAPAHCNDNITVGRRRKIIVMSIDVRLFFRNRSLAMQIGNGMADK